MTDANWAGVRIARTGALTATDQVRLAAPLDRRVEVRARAGVRQYAGGVRRAISLPGHTLIVTLEIPRPTVAVVAELREWVGETVLYRDGNVDLWYALLKSANDSVHGRDGAPVGQVQTVRLVLETTTQTPESLL